MSDSLFGLLLAAGWAVAAGALGAWSRDDETNTPRNERWPWMYLAYARTGIAAAVAGAMGFSLVVVVGFLYGFMFVLGPGLIIWGITGSDISAAGRIAILVGGSAATFVFTYYASVILKREWDEKRDEDLRRHFDQRAIDDEGNPLSEDAAAPTRKQLEQQVASLIERRKQVASLIERRNELDRATEEQLAICTDPETSESQRKAARQELEQIEDRVNYLWEILKQA